MDKKKALIIGGGAIAAGVFLYSQKGTEGALGTAGNIVAAPIDAFTGGEDTGVPDAGTPTPGEWIPQIMDSLPSFGEGGSMLPSTPMPNLSEITESVTTAADSKKSMSGSGLGLKALGAVARVGATGVMAPTQFLGGTAARVTDSFARYAMGSNIKSLRKAQRSRVKKYGRASHAVSMITGGATARSKVTKKQTAARKKYPRVYKAWKSVFSWVGA